MKLAYADDRRKKQEHDKLEKERRIRAAASPAPPTTVTRISTSSRPTPQIRGEGRTLSGAVEPPPYSPTAHPHDVVRPEDARADDAADDDAEAHDGEDEDMDDAASQTSLRGGRRLGD